ncbi:FAD-binding oxidoreductase [Zavarzinella formosa]|uniref:FAD-binding oxidoreductase n=1 Tax=Zavarzinella formosa TaxID=360055 RepID=UPI000315B8D6|nr:FAD-binding oxidoreductase [Zavarzinella formosa]
MDRSVTRQRLRDDLRKLFHGNLHIDPLRCRLYATDASLFHLEPLAVAEPQTTDDMRVLVTYAREHDLTIIPRGGGTGLAGEALGSGIVVDCSVHLRNILEIGPDFARVQPGVVLRDLNNELRKTGRRFAIDTASENACTLGGMWATDASGNRANLHGSTRDHVASLQVLWDDSTISSASDMGLESSRPALIAAQLREVIASLPEPPVRQHRFDHAGYHLPSGNLADLTPVLVGSEGTLGLFTEGTLRTVPLAGGVSAALFAFSSVEAALETGLLMADHRPAACEMLDRRLIGLARMHSENVARLVSPDTEAVVIVEFEGDSPSEARDRLRQLLADLERRSTEAIPAVLAETTEDVSQLWDLRRRSLPSPHGRNTGPRPLSGVEDAGVSPHRLPELWARAKHIFRRRELLMTTIVHVATGQVHFRPLLDADQPADLAKLWPVAEELHSLVIELGGTVSSQHGVGLARTPWVERQTGDLYAVYRDVKRIFDPRGIFNPGKIIGPDPSRPAWPFRPAAAIPLVAKPLPLLDWKPEEPAALVQSCNACGQCRTQQPDERMCPIFRVIRGESASPRAKINLLREVLSNPDFTLDSPAVKPVADLCVNCRMCGKECPGEANIPKLMLEVKAAQHAKHGLTRTDWMLARIDGLTRIASRFAITTNILLRQPSVRWVLEKAFGLSRHRTLPSLAFWTFMGKARRRGWTKPLPEGTKGYAYFADTYANLFDPTVAEASVRVMQHNGLPVTVPAGQIGTGAAALAQGDTDIARERLRKNTRVLADAVRRGHQIVCSEPTAALFFQLDSLNLSDSPEVKLIADNTIELTTLLGELHDQGKLNRDFQPLPVSLGHHVPCHVKARPGKPRGPELLSLIPELRVETIDVSCSGMAGMYGLKRGNRELSLLAGKPMLDELSRPKHLYGSSECSSCRLQMQEGTGKRALHPVQYLAMAYGLMPELTDHLRRPWTKRVSS